MKPTAQEIERTIKARHSTRETRPLVRLVLSEADQTQIMAAEATGAFSLQDLAWWIHNMEYPCYDLIRWLNALARSWWLRQQSRTPEDDQGR